MCPVTDLTANRYLTTLTVSGQTATLTTAPVLCSLSIGGRGPAGADGVDGASAYQIWLDEGNVGDEAAFLASLVGPQGEQGLPGADGLDGEDGEQGLQGDPGPGLPEGGSTGQVARKTSGEDYATEWHSLTASDVGADASGTASSAVGTHESTYSHANLHARSHALDSADDHTGLTATEDNFLSATATGLPKDSGSKASDFVASDDSRLTDSRTPTAHKTSHSTGGSDAIAPGDIGAATATHTTPAASTSAAGHVELAVDSEGETGTSDSLVPPVSVVKHMIDYHKPYATDEQAIALTSDEVVLTPDNLGAVIADRPSGFKNLIINGNFDIWQRGTSGFTDRDYTADRWNLLAGSAAQSSDVPNDNSMYSISITRDGNTIIRQRTESFNSKYLVGKDITVSFYAKSTTDSGENIQVSLQYTNTKDTFTATATQETLIQTMGTVNTWGFYSFTFNDLDDIFVNGLQLLIGQTSGAATARNTLYSQVQLEVGDVATPFEVRPIGLELALCQRYYESKTVRAENGSRHIPLVTKRTTPTIAVGVGSSGNITTDGFELTHTSAADCTVTADAEL